MVIGMVTKLDHESVKVPVREQIVCAGCAKTDKVIGLLMIGSPKDGEEIVSARDAENPINFVHFIR